MPLMNCGDERVSRARAEDHHVLGLDHTKLTYRCARRDFRLTDVSGEIVRDILA